MQEVIRNTSTSKPLRWFLIVGLLAGGGLWGYRYLQAPAEGIVRSPAAVPQTKAATTPTPISGKTFAIDLPSDYTPLQTKPGAAPVLEQLSFSRHTGTESRRINITIKKAPPAIMNEDSAFAFRKQSNQYKMSDVLIADRSGFKAVKNDSTEITFFVPGPTSYAIIAATSSAPDSAFADDVTAVLSSFLWK